nr:zinc finger, CCHC-type [Tanacetum cinerariifolium]
MDRCGEFTSHNFNRFCDEEGIKRMLMAPYAPQQNGIVERRNRTLLEMTRCIMKAKGVPNYFWGETVRHATNIINRTPTRALVGVTSYEKFNGEKPNPEDLKKTDTQETDKNKAKNNKTKHKVEKIGKDKVIRSQKSKVKARGQQKSTPGKSKSTPT